MKEAKEAFSFVYGGEKSEDLLAGWERDEHSLTFREPGDGLEVRCERRTFHDPSATDWVLWFTNRGPSESRILEAVLPLDMALDVPAGDVMLHRAYGSTATVTDFIPVDEALEPGGTVESAPNGGRSSDGVLPFFNMAWAGDPAGGLAWAIGWSGQWSQRVRRDEGGAVRIEAGQQTFRTKLLPGETVRTPRILLVPWRGLDRMRGHNLLRRVILAHYAPRLDGEVVMPPVSQNMWFLCGEGNETTEENQLERMRAMPDLGVEVEWLDAGWFEGGWPNGVGSWVPKTDHFPRGLKPLGDEAHKLGLKFLVWFEPERVHAESRIGKEHPEFVLGWEKEKSGNGLFNLGDPAAREWLTDHLSGCIADGGIDIYRTDFNIAPLPFWEGADEPDRRGITENRYVTGLYAMWDELRRRHPRLVFDNCASGGRRIDLEMMTRSYAISRSDSVCSGGYTAAWDQAQTAGLCLYVPLNATLATCGIPSLCNKKPSNVALDPYGLRSTATSGLGICQDTFAAGTPTDVFKKIIEEVKSLRPYYTGDFYPLTPINTNPDAWCAWQFDRPDLESGFAMCFRRPESEEACLTLALRGVDPNAKYEVSLSEMGESRSVSGEELAGLTVEIPEAPGSMLVRYRKAKG